MEWLISIGIFVAAVFVIEGILFLVRPKWDREMLSPEKRLEMSMASGAQQGAVDIVRRRSLSDIPRLHEMFSKIPLMHRLDKLVVQANVRWPLGVFVLLSLVLALACYLLLCSTDQRESHPYYHRHSCRHDPVFLFVREKAATDPEI